MYRFFDPSVHYVFFSVNDLGMVPIYDMVRHTDIWWRMEITKSLGESVNRKH